MSILLFEDDWTKKLDPIAVGQPAFSVGCGSYRLCDVVARLGQPTRHLVRPHLRGIQQADFPDTDAQPHQRQQPLLLVSGRLVPSEATLAEIRRIWSEGRPGIVRRGEQVAVAILSPQERAALGEPTDFASLAAWLEGRKLAPLAASFELFEYPHDVVRHHSAVLAANLTARIAGGGYREAADGVYLAPGAKLGQYVDTDTRDGPIVLEADAFVGAHSSLAGPVYLGAGARVADHASVKHNVALGHTTRLGGEVTETIIEPYSNKQHHGFLGHSYLGRWVNLGAGTSTSNLKNTYGLINMDYGGRKVATGMQFLGCIVGDYAKAAINTGIFTGKTVGVCSMLYGFVTTNVPPYVNYARSFGQISEVPVEVMVAAQARMFARRNVQQRPCDVELLQAMFRLTASQRAAEGQPMSDEPLSL